jgi:acyl transferase domain-containing protein/acyl carrier protein
MTEQTKRTGLEVAVIGMAAAFPGAGDIETFWENLREGVSSIQFLNDEDLERHGVPKELSQQPNFVPSRGGVLDNRELFDAEFFGYTPLEARVMDPQLRLLHQCCWQALEHAGYCPDDVDGTIGLYAGSASNFDWQALVLTSGQNRGVEQFVLDQLLDKNFICTRVAYKLNLRGPAVAVQSACSTSLLAIHLATRALVTGECDLALAGGVAVQAIQPAGYLHHEGMVMSPDGLCRSFDAGANGTIGGNGVGIVALKRLKFAEKHGDHILAVIKGSGSNNDGNRKVGFTAPSIEAQEALVRSVLHVSRVPADSISYVEAHGSGTPLGDPIEIEALTGGFNTQSRQYCAIGSVKTNIGHLDTAAGVAGFIKAVLALHHKAIPPSLNYEIPNPRIDFPRTPFYVNTTLKEWDGAARPLRAAVNSLGIGGTNVFILLEEGAPPQPIKQPEKPQLLLLSAPTATGLEKIKSNITHYLEQHPDTNLQHMAFTLSAGRRHSRYRAYCAAQHAEEALSILSDSDSRQYKTFDSKGKNPDIVFLFQGLGSQYVNMGKELYHSMDVFRQELDACFAILKELSPVDFKGILYPHGGENPDDPGIHEPDIAQPILFSFEYAVAATLKHLGIQPYAVMGYSFGEYVAACVAGVFSLRNALELVVNRGRMIGSLPAGGMLSCPLPKEDILPFLNNDLFLAIDNGESCVVAGTIPALEQLEGSMKAKKLFTVRLPSGHALHSQLMGPLEQTFTQMVDSLNPQEATIPMISNVTGTWAAADELADPSYWFQHLSQPVLFDDGVRCLLEKKNTLIIEIGAGSDLTALMRKHVKPRPDVEMLNLFPAKERGMSSRDYVLGRLGGMWSRGAAINWKRFYSEEPVQRIPLPTYPFDKKRYWIDGNPLKHLAAQEKSRGLHKKERIDDWFYIPSWKRSIPQNRSLQVNGDGEHWLAFVDRSPFCRELVERLKARGIQLSLVYPGDTYQAGDDNIFQIDPKNKEDYNTLLNEIGKTGTPPQTILHLWSLSGDEGETGDSFDAYQYKNLYSLLFLVHGLEDCPFKMELALNIVSGGCYDVTGKEMLRPEGATIGGAVKVIGQEYPYLSVRHIDIEAPEKDEAPNRPSLDLLMNELNTAATDPLVVFRGAHRLLPSFEPVPLNGSTQPIPQLKQKGVYLITGGLGKIGFTCATFLAREYKARLALTSRKEQADQDKIKQLEELGADVLAKSVDVADLDGMKRLAAKIEETWGAVNGIIHAAGMVGGDSFALAEAMTVDRCRQQFTAKVYGVQNIAAVFSAEDLDFCLLTSSLSPILGGLGFLAYAAANSFMDAFVFHQNRCGTFPWIAVNWADWKFDDSNRDGGDQVGASVQKLMISPSEGIETLRRILAHIPANQVVVSSGDLNARIDQWVKLQSLKKENDSSDNKDEAENTEFHQRPDLLSEYAEPRNSLERDLVDSWQEMFGIEPIGIDDDFFELGGDSLKAISVVSHVYRQFSVKIPLVDMLKKTTVRKIAQMISETHHAEEVVALLNDEGPRKIFCFPPSGAYAISYKNFSAQFEDTSVYAFTFLEEEDRLERYVDAILEIDHKGPYVFFAYSAGGSLLMEVAAQLEARGSEVADIILGDSHWWQGEDDHEEEEDAGEGDGQKYNEAFLQEVERQIQLMGIEFLKDDIVRKIDAYHSYLANIETLRPVNATIHLIKSEDRDNLDEDTGFRQFSNNKYIEYNGYGPHDQMLKGQFLEKNVVLIKQILADSFACLESE